MLTGTEQRTLGAMWEVIYTWMSPSYWLLWTKATRMNGLLCGVYGTRGSIYDIELNLVPFQYIVNREHWWNRVVIHKPLSSYLLPLPNKKTMGSLFFSLTWNLSGTPFSRCRVLPWVLTPFGVPFVMVTMTRWHLLKFWGFWLFKLAHKLFNHWASPKPKYRILIQLLKIHKGFHEWGKLCASFYTLIKL